MQGVALLSAAVCSLQLRLLGHTVEVLPATNREEVTISLFLRVSLVCVYSHALCVIVMRLFCECVLLCVLCAVVVWWCGIIVLRWCGGLTVCWKLCGGDGHSRGVVMGVGLCVV